MHEEQGEAGNNDRERGEGPNTRRGPPPPAPCRGDGPPLLRTGAPLARPARRFRTPSTVETALSGVGPALTVRPSRGRSERPAPPALLGRLRHPHLPCRPWRAGKPGGSRGRALREGRGGCGRSLCARGRYCFLLPCVRSDLRTFAPTLANRSAEIGRVGGETAFTAYPEARSLSAGPKRALRPCPRTAWS